MAINIVQHRRGTTAEWLENNIVPYEGELVIEECIDGTCKCKIGDSKLKFSELPYLSNPISAEYLKAITDNSNQLSEQQTSIKDLQDKLLVLQNSLEQELVNLELAVDTKINLLSVETIKSQLSEANSDILKLIADLNEFKQINTDKLKAIELNVNSLETEISKLPIDTSIDSKIKAANDDIINQVNTKIELEKTNLNNKITDVHASTTKELFIIRENLSKLDSEYNTKLKDAQNKIYTAFNLKIENSVLNLENQIASLDEKVIRQEADLLGQLKVVTNNIIKEYTLEINTLKTDFTSFKQITENTLDSIQNTVEKLKTDMINKFLEIDHSILVLQENDAQIIDFGHSIRNENISWHQALNASIKSLQDTSVTLKTDHEEIQSTIFDLKKQLENKATKDQLEDLRQTLEDHIEHLDFSVLHDHDNIEALDKITEKDVTLWHSIGDDTNKALNRYVYVEKNKLCTGKEAVKEIVLDCGTA